MTENTGAAFGLASATEAPLDPSSFNLDDWIAGVTRPTEIVRLYGKGHLNERLKELEREITLVRKTPAEERGITDTTVAGLQAEWDEVAAEMVASARPFKVRALTSDEIETARAEGKKAKATDAEQVLYVVAAATVEPRVTPQQLVRLRDAGGDAGLAQMYAVVMRLSNNTVAPTVPFSQKPSGGPRG